MACMYGSIYHIKCVEEQHNIFKKSACAMWIGTTTIAQMNFLGCWAA